MRRVSSEIQIDAPRRRVYDLLSDPWVLGGVLGAQEGLSDTPEPPLRRGAAFEQTIDVVPARVRVRWTATRARRPDAIEWRGEGPASALALIGVALSSPVRGRTRVDYELRLEPPGGPLGRVVERVVANGRLESHARSAFERIRDHLEAA